MELLEIFGQSIVTGLVTGVAAWAAIRVEIKYLRRDVDRAHERLTRHEDIKHG